MCRVVLIVFTDPGVIGLPVATAVVMLEITSIDTVQRVSHQVIPNSLDFH